MEQSEFVKSFAGSNFEKELKTNIFTMGILPIIVETGCDINQEDYDIIVDSVVEEALTKTAAEFSPEDLQIASDNMIHPPLDDDGDPDLDIDTVVVMTRVGLKLGEFLEPALVSKSDALMGVFIDLPESYK